MSDEQSSLPDCQPCLRQINHRKTLGFALDVRICALNALVIKKIYTDNDVVCFRMPDAFKAARNIATQVVLGRHHI